MLISVFHKAVHSQHCHSRLRTPDHNILVVDSINTMILLLTAICADWHEVLDAKLKLTNYIARPDNQQTNRSGCRSYRKYLLPGYDLTKEVCEIKAVEGS